MLVVLESWPISAKRSRVAHHHKKIYMTITLAFEASQGTRDIWTDRAVEVGKFNLFKQRKVIGCHDAMFGRKNLFIFMYSDSGSIDQIFVFAGFLSILLLLGLRNHC